jgi:hypothetical protein
MNLHVPWQSLTPMTPSSCSKKEMKRVRKPKPQNENCVMQECARSLLAFKVQRHGVTVLTNNDSGGFTRPPRRAWAAVPSQLPRPTLMEMQGGFDQRELHFFHPDSVDHRLRISGGPAWTPNAWQGAFELDNAAAIAWNANAGGQRFGIGQSFGDLFFFRTASDRHHSKRGQL